MRLLAFLARRFAWSGHEPSLSGEGGEARAGEDHARGRREVRDAVVVFVHAEAKDEDDEERGRVFRRTLKHVKWLANKRDLRQVVLHSFAHLGGESSSPAFTRAFLEELGERLEATGYSVSHTPFGWFSAWELDVHGEGLAKVWKAF